MDGKDPQAEDDKPSRFLDDLLYAFSLGDRRRSEVENEIGSQKTTGGSRETPLFIEAATTVNATVTPGTIATTTTLTKDKFGRGISGLTLLLVTLTAFFTGLQWRTMDKTLREIQRQTTATQDAALGTISSAATAHQALETDQRPYLVAEPPTFVINGVDYTPKAGGGVEAQFVVRNIGKTPAKSYFVSYHLYLYSFPSLEGRVGEEAEKFSTKAVTQFLDAKLAEVQRDLVKGKRNRTVWMGGGDLAPAVSAVYDSNKEPNWTPIRISNESELRKLRTSESLLLYIGRIEYGDTFGKARSTDFCFRYFGSGQSDAWHACEWHNVIQ